MPSNKILELKQLRRIFKLGCDYFVTTETACANITAYTLAVKKHAFSLEVDAPASLCAKIRVANIVTGLWSTITNHTCSRHFKPPNKLNRATNIS